MTKKTESKASTLIVDHYYIKDHFVKFIEPSYLSKKTTQKTVIPKVKSGFSYTNNLTEVHDPRKQKLIDLRMDWYDAIESGKLRPSIDKDGNFRLQNGSFRNSQHTEWCELIELIASQWVEREIYRSSRTSSQENIELILQALTQLTRYLPELQERQPNYFLDIETYKIGVTVQSEGTLTLLIGGNSEIEYSYAQRQEKGTIRISGIAKLTTNIRNSKNIRKLLNLQGVVE